MTGDPVADGGGSKGVLSDFLVRPKSGIRLAPCAASCVTGGDPRIWIAPVAQRHDLGMEPDAAFDLAWRTVAETNPFPATLGRICPHPCEVPCTRSTTDGAVSIYALERFLGDWGIERDLPLPVLDVGPRPESAGVVGGGPAGLSFAYQMARRGYRVTVYERRSRLGGMLRFGVPPFRLPEAVLEKEIQRILDLGIEIRTGVTIGRDIPVDDLRGLHDMVFLGIGAQSALRLEVPGETGDGVWSGIEFLDRFHSDLPIVPGSRVAVVGGGNTAVDAARVARRTGAEVVLCYRRSRGEMSAIRSEIEAALEEGIRLETRVAPVRIERYGRAVRSLVLERTGPSEEDFGTPVRSISGTVFEISVDAVIVAVSQTSDWADLGWHPDPDAVSSTPSGSFAVGGDAIRPDLAGRAIAEGRRAAETLHAQLRGLPAPITEVTVPIPFASVRSDLFEPLPPVVVPTVRPADRLADPAREIHPTLSMEQALVEVDRCFSCGLCFGCGRCDIFCNAEAFVPVATPRPGRYFEVALELCEGCGQCIEICPSGFLEPGPPSRVGPEASGSIESSSGRGHHLR